MICQKCNWDNVEGSSFCNNCGYDLKQTMDSDLNQNDIPELSQDEKKRTGKSNKKKIFLLLAMFLLLAIAISSVIGYKIHNENIKKQEEAKALNALKQYQTEFISNTIILLEETYLTEKMCSEVSETWRSAIDSDKDFNDEIISLYKSWKYVGDLQKRDDAKNKLENGMKEIQNPPKEYVEAHKLLVDIYTTYTQIYSQATNPKGSLTTYLQDVNQNISDFDKLYEKLKVIEPEIEKKLNKK